MVLCGVNKWYFPLNGIEEERELFELLAQLQQLVSDFIWYTDRSNY